LVRREDSGKPATIRRRREKGKGGWWQDDREQQNRGISQERPKEENVFQ